MLQKYLRRSSLSRCLCGSSRSIYITSMILTSYLLLILTIRYVNLGPTLSILNNLFTCHLCTITCPFSSDKVFMHYKWLLKVALVILSSHVVAWSCPAILSALPSLSFLFSTVTRDQQADGAEGHRFLIARIQGF